MAVIVGNQPELGGDPLQGMGPAMLDYLRGKLDLSMVADAPGVSRYAVSSVDAGNVPSLTGSSSIAGGGGTGVTSVFGRSGSVIALVGDYSAFYLGLTATAVAAVKLATARTINGVAFDGTANIVVTAAAGTLTGATLAANVLNSSLTSVGTLLNLTVTNTITGSISGNAATVTTNADLTGPVTSVGNATAVTANAITNAMLAQMATLTVKGNNSGATANALDLTVAQLNAILPVFTSTLNGLAPLSGGGTANFLRADGSWAVPPGAVTSVFGRTGAVLATSTDYTLSLVGDGLTTLSIGTGDGTTVSFAKPASWQAGAPVYKSDWQGNQLQYSTPRTNYLGATDLQSNWAGVATTPATITLAQSDPSGGTKAILVTAGSAAYGGIIRAGYILNSYLNLPSYGMTAFVKGGTATYVGLRSHGYNGGVGLSSDYYNFVDISTLTVTNGLNPGETLSAESVDSGWIRLSLSTPGQASDLNTVDIAIVDSTGNVRTATLGGETLYVFAPNVQGMGNPGSYIPTPIPPVTVTDYSLTSTDIVFASAPVTSAVLTAKVGRSAVVNGPLLFGVLQVDEYSRALVDLTQPGHITPVGILYGTGSTTTPAVAADFPTLNQNTTGNAATVTTNADLTGPVTSVGNATAVTANAITNAMLAQMATLTVKGNNSGATANALDLTVAQLNAILPVFTSTLNGLAPLSGGGTANFLRADGSWAVPPAGAGTVTSVSVVSANGFAGTVATATTTPAITIETSITGILHGNGTAVAAAVAADFPTLNQNTTGNAATVTTNADLTGPVTSVGNATAVTANAITNAMLAQMATLTVKGNNSGATANALDLTVAQLNAILPVFTSTLNGLAPLSGGGTANFLRADGSWAVPPAGAVTSVFGRTGAVVAASGDYSAFYLGLTATAVAATKLATARTIDGVAFDGTANISIPLDDVPDGPTNFVRRTQQAGNASAVEVPDALFQLGSGSTLPPGWVANLGSPTVSYPTASPAPAYGTQYLKMVASTAAHISLESVAQFKVRPGDTVCVGGTAYAVSGVAAIIGVNFYEGNGTSLGTLIFGNTAAAAWTAVEASGVAPANTAYMTLVVQVNATASGQSGLFNDVWCSINDVRVASFGNAAPASIVLVSATTYQNTTGGPIVLYIPISYTNTATAGTVQVFLGPSSIPAQIFQNESNLGVTAKTETITLMVPKNWYYKLLINAAATIGTVYMVNGF
ncbi:MAG: beta strand repeat-containing protein [Gammaproteobacteria bacterium]